MTRPDLSAADNHFKQAHNLYREYVRRAIENTGAHYSRVEKLLKLPEKTISKALERDRITKLRELAIKIQAAGL